MSLLVWRLVKAGIRAKEREKILMSMNDFEQFDQEFEDNEPSLASLHSLTLDMNELLQAVADDEKKSGGKKEQHIFPEGVYRVQPPGKHNMKKNLDGHEVANYYPIIEGHGHKDRYGFELSPVKYEGKFGTAISYRLFARAAVAYQEVLGKAPQTVEEVFSFVDNYPLDIHLVVTKTGRNFPLSLKGVKGAVARDAIEE